jgi:hypothetical protein
MKRVELGLSGAHVAKRRIEGVGDKIRRADI